MAKQQEQTDYNITFLNNVDLYNYLSTLDKSTARTIAPAILKAIEIPHGDLSIPTLEYHSGRVFISQWQRLAIGSTVVVLIIDTEGNIYVIMGAQRGTMRIPQGYMEAALPKEDLTGFKEKGASRLNRDTNELVEQDNSIEDNAIREVWEEAGIKITKDELILLGITSNINSNPVCVAANYMVKFDYKDLAKLSKQGIDFDEKDLPKLSTKDVEFADDDLSHPKWFKLSDIMYNRDKNQYFISQLPDIPLDTETVRNIKLALKTLNMPLLLISSEEEVSNDLKTISTEGANIIENKQYEKCSNYFLTVENLIKNYKTLTESAKIKISEQLNKEFISIIHSYNLMIKDYQHFLETSSSRSEDLLKFFQGMLSEDEVESNDIVVLPMQEEASMLGQDSNAELVKSEF